MRHIPATVSEKLFFFFHFSPVDAPILRRARHRLGQAPHMGREGRHPPPGALFIRDMSPHGCHLVLPGNENLNVPEENSRVYFNCLLFTEMSIA